MVLDCIDSWYLHPYLLRGKLIDLVERAFNREGLPYRACNDRNAFFTSEKRGKCHAWSCRLCVMHWPFCWTIFYSIWHQTVWTTGWDSCGHCAPVVANFFLFCYEGDLMIRNSEYHQKIPQSQTADKPRAPWGKATRQSWDTSKTNIAKQSAFSSPSRWLQN